MKQKLIVMVGLPGSGKSTKAKQIAEDNDFAYISRDFIRSLLGLDHGEKQQEVCKKVYLGFVEASLMSGETVVADATHLNVGSRLPLVELGKKYGVEIISIKMDTTYETCILRNSQRDSSQFVPHDVIKNMAKHMTTPTKTEGFSNVYLYTEGEEDKWN